LLDPSLRNFEQGVLQEELLKISDGMVAKMITMAHILIHEKKKVQNTRRISWKNRLRDPRVFLRVD
jgi:hypothetical protein